MHAPRSHGSEYPPKIWKQRLDLFRGLCNDDIEASELGSLSPVMAESVLVELLNAKRSREIETNIFDRYLPEVLVLSYQHNFRFTREFLTEAGFDDSLEQAWIMESEQDPSIMTAERMSRLAGILRAWIFYFPEVSKQDHVFRFKRLLEAYIDSPDLLRRLIMDLIAQSSETIGAMSTYNHWVYTNIKSFEILLEAITFSLMFNIRNHGTPSLFNPENKQQDLLDKARTLIKVAQSAGLDLVVSDKGESVWQWKIRNRVYQAPATSQLVLDEGQSVEASFSNAEVQKLNSISK